VIRRSDEIDQQLAHLLDALCTKALAPVALDVRDDLERGALGRAATIGQADDPDVGE
jgi:hypothetical protein